MKCSKIAFLRNLAAIFAFAAVSMFSQTPRPDFNRASTYDVQHYIIRASFDRVNKKVFGDTTVSLKPLKDGFREVALDAEDMAFDSVKLEPGGTALKHRLIPGKIVVTLDKAYGPADLIGIRFKYTSAPTKGVYFVEAENSAGV